MNNVNKAVETIFDIPLFSWSGWDEMESGHLTFYGVDWYIDAMKEKYNGRTVDRKLDGTIIIYNEDGEVEFTCFPCDFEEVREAIVAREVIL